MEAEHDPAVTLRVVAGCGPLGGFLRIASEHLDIGGGDFAGCGRVLIGDIGDICRINDDVDAVELAEFPQLERGEGALQGPRRPTITTSGHPRWRRASKA